MNKSAPITAVDSANRSITRPVDAAGLVLLRNGARGPEVLLGRRHRQAGFLPDIYVFPGGRVDRQDVQPSGFIEDLHPNVARQLRGAGSRRPEIAFARAALRETLEETGLLLASPDHRDTPIKCNAPHWQAFLARGVRPGFAQMDLVCRAITPTYSERRYNTRFFLADGSRLRGTLAGDGELEDLAWRPLAEIDSLRLVDVTQFVLAVALRRWRLGAAIGTEAARLYCYRGDTARWRIGLAGSWRSAPEKPLKSVICQG